MRTSAKIKKRKIETGYAFSFSIVHNYRNPFSGSPTNKTVAYFGSVRDSEIPAKSTDWWKRVDAKLDELISDGVVWASDAASAKRKFEEIVPHPRSAK